MDILHVIQFVTSMDMQCGHSNSRAYRCNSYVLGPCDITSAAAGQGLRLYRVVCGEDKLLGTGRRPDL